jgi:hypothetical protein
MKQIKTVQAGSTAKKKTKKHATKGATRISFDSWVE